LDGLKESVNMEELFAIDKKFWNEEVEEIKEYLEEQVGQDLPQEIKNEVEQLKIRLNE